ncbi:MAG: HAD hydrolase-like protein [Oscillospiraceae bacterium]|nr:HAD hydrolase-like protein [Oscillospiraceae bacterium]
MKKTIIFDLDGTLTDSAEGITNSVKLVMSHFNIPIPGMDVLHTFVGPPLHDMFVKHGVPEDRVEEAIAVFRSRYTTIGKYENTPYPGVFELLQKLKKHGHTLYVATSKPEPQAKDILEHFELAPYFDCICGASLDRSRITKEEVLRYLLDMSPDPGEAVMVGDTVYDVVGASALGLPTIGVAWGYGAAADMAAAGAIAIADTMETLYKLLK